MLSFSGVACMNHSTYIVVLLIICCSHVTAVDVYVNPGSLSDVNNAVSQSNAGDVIILNPGTYNMCSTSITINKNVTVRGIGAIVQCAGVGVVIVTASGCNGARIEHLIIYDAVIAVRHESSSSLLIADDIIIRRYW